MKASNMGTIDAENQSTALRTIAMAVVLALVASLAGLSAGSGI